MEINDKSKLLDRCRPKANDLLSGEGCWPQHSFVDVHGISAIEVPKKVSAAHSPRSDIIDLFPLTTA